LLSLAFALPATGAWAQNTVAASFAWTNAQLSQLQFTPPAYRQANVGLVFSDPRKQGQIAKIIFDPVFKPSRQMPDGQGGQMEVNDFFAQTSIKSPQSGSTISEIALCDWNDDKSLATCVIEDDGGRFQIEANRNTAAPQKPDLNFVLRQIAGYKSFVIAEYDSPSKEPIRIEVSLIQPDSVVKAPIKY
jgi:hypothetical protein